jgi:hypothetical protein
MGTLKRVGSTYPLRAAMTQVRAPVADGRSDDPETRSRQSVGKLRGLGVKTVYPGHGKPFALSALAPR